MCSLLLVNPLVPFEGVDEGDGWLCVSGELYLPMQPRPENSVALALRAVELFSVPLKAGGRADPHNRGESGNGNGRLAVCLATHVRSHPGHLQGCRWWRPWRSVGVERGESGESGSVWEQFQEREADPICSNPSFVAILCSHLGTSELVVVVHTRARGTSELDLMQVSGILQGG